jgi:glutamate synthase domain-containing protein 3
LRLARSHDKKTRLDQKEKHGKAHSEQQQRITLCFTIYDHDDVVLSAVSLKHARSSTWYQLKLAACKLFRQGRTVSSVSLQW